ncbi:M1 family metallopeptidase [candidate division WOR-3 bacterium]|nr:M1 family metallopeptidase [candidate division WOR-3 bacterium]
MNFLTIAFSLFILSAFPEEDKFSDINIYTWTESFGFDVLKYELDLFFYEPFDTLSGKCMMFSSALGQMNIVKYHLGSDMKIDSILFNGAKAQVFERTLDTVTLRTEVLLDSGDFFSVTTFYHGKPSSGLYTAFGGFFTDVQTLQASKQWWPCVDFCGEKSDSGIDISVTVPRSLYAVSNGNLHSIDTLENNKLRFNWKHPYPISTYLVAVLCSDYAILEKDIWAGNLIYYAIKGNENTALTMLDSSEIIVSFFESIIAPYPFAGEKIGQCQSGGRGAMENQTCIRYSPGSWAATLVHAHELAHTWWGNAVTCSDYSEMFINEGTASYYELLAALELRGDSMFKERLLYIRERALKWDDDHHWPIIGSPDPFGSNVYWKGAWFYRMLRELTGDSLFFLSMKNFYSEFLWKNASSEDLLNTFETNCAMELSYFFEQWLKGVDYPNLSLNWCGNSESLCVIISQNSWSGRIYSFPLEIALWKEGRVDSILVLWMDIDSVYVIIHHDIPDSVTLDPDDKLFYRKTKEASEETAENYTALIFRVITGKSFILESKFFDGSVFLFDVAGRKVLEFNIHPGEILLWEGLSSSGAYLPNGIYLLRSDPHYLVESIFVIK